MYFIKFCFLHSHSLYIILSVKNSFKENLPLDAFRKTISAFPQLPVFVSVERVTWNVFKNSFVSKEIYKVRRLFHPILSYRVPLSTLALFESSKNPTNSREMERGTGAEKTMLAQSVE